MVKSVVKIKVASTSVWSFILPRTPDIGSGELHESGEDVNKSGEGSHDLNIHVGRDWKKRNGSFGGLYFGKLVRFQKASFGDARRFDVSKPRVTPSTLESHGESIRCHGRLHIRYPWCTQESQD